MGRKENYGAVKEVIEVCAVDLTAGLRALRTRADLLEAGHQRYKLIDNLMNHAMGDDVRKYWAAQTETYRSLLRRKVWEAALKGLDRKASKQ